MQRTIAGLTTRGRSFTAVGVTTILCAFVLGERDLLRAGLLALTLPLLAALAVSRTRYRLTCTRRLDPPRLPVGHETQVDLHLENASWLPTGLLLVEDQAPYALDARARFVVDRIKPHGAQELSYRLRSDVRGRYRVGPLTVRLVDPFGLVELDRSLCPADPLTVTPALVPLPPDPMVGVRTGNGESLARMVSNAGEDDMAPREYRHGDDLRRVHWRSTARYGELMVRREEQPRRNSGTLFLDTRHSAHRGEGPGSSFEQAVSATASIGVWLSREGLGLRFMTDTGETLSTTGSFTGSSTGTFESALLETLAIVQASGGRSLSPGLDVLRGAAGHGPEGNGLIVAVFGMLDAAQAQSVASIRRATATCVAVLVDITVRAGKVTPAASTITAANTLRAAGWRVVTISSAAALATAWADVGRSADHGRPGADDRVPDGSGP